MFILAFARGDNITNENSYRRYFLTRLKIKNYNIEIDGRNFYEQIKIRIYYILEKSKEKILEFAKGTTKFL